MKRRYLSVTEINNYIYRLIKSDPITQSIYVQGEISNCKLSPNGFVFFSLKDEESKIDCSLFNTDILEFQLKDGMQVEIMGNINYYQKNGSLKINVNYIKDVGEGIAFRRYRDLAEQLNKEGLLDQKYKKELVKIPTSIGVITSPTGSVLQDIIKVRNNRHPQANIYVYPTTVQGEGTAHKVKNGIVYFNENKVDIIIIARGGGSYEDLIEFNDEGLAREVFKSEIPIISAIGHETDTTILDLVSDYRASTPSVAAEIALPSNEELINDLGKYFKNISYLVNKNIFDSKGKIEDNKKLIEANNPKKNFTIKRERLLRLFEKVVNEIGSNMNENRMHLDSVGRSLVLLNPLLPYEKGFTIVKRDHELITKGEYLIKDDLVTLEFIDKKIDAKII